MVKGPEWFKMYFNISMLLEDMEDAEIGRAFRWAIIYGETGQETNDLNPLERHAYKVMRRSIREAYFDYAKKAEAGRQSAEKRWHRNTVKN